MTIWNRIRGHEAQVGMFRRSIGRGRLAHAYLFVGPDGIGKRRFARMFAQCLFCERRRGEDLDACGECSSCKQMQAGTHPDYLAVGRPEGKSVVPIELFAGPEERRGREGLCHDLMLRPMSATRRVAVIDDAQLMSTEAANALLKTLEEPPAYAVMILISTGLDSLLPTIRSRCQLMRFAPLPPSDVADLLLEQEQVGGRDEAEAVASLSEGSLTTAARLIDPELRALRGTLYEHLATDRFQGLRIAGAVLERLEAMGGDSASQRENARWVIRFCQEFYRHAIRSLSADENAGPVPEAEKFAARFPPGSADAIELLARVFDRTTLAERQLDQKTAVPLCLEGLFDELGRLQRPPAKR